MASRSSIEGTVEKVTEEALKEFMTELEEGYDQALQLLDNSESLAIDEVTKMLDDRNKQADALRRQIIGRAQLSARNISMELIEDGMNKVFAKALLDLKKAKSKEHYGTILERLMEEGIELIEGKSFVISGSEDDSSLLANLARRVSESKKLSVKLSEENINCVGGVQVMSSDGTVVYDNTYDARLERLKPMLRRKVASLFSK